MRSLMFALAVLVALPAAAYAAPPEMPADDMDTMGNALAGQTLAENLCATCHALDVDKASPNEAAPNFNALSLAYPPEYLAEGFAEGIVVGTDAHIAMPQFELSTDQINDLIAYLDTVLPPPVDYSGESGGKEPDAQ